MKLRWLRSGSESLKHHVAFVASENPAAARQTRLRIRATVLRLAEFPAIGRPGTVAGTHEIVIPDLPYLVVYRRTPDAVEIIRVLHTSTNWRAIAPCEPQS